MVVKTLLETGKKIGTKIGTTGDAWFEKTKKLQRSEKSSERIRGNLRVIAPMTVAGTVGAIGGIKDAQEEIRNRGVYGVERKPLPPKSIKTLPSEIIEQFKTIKEDFNFSFIGSAEAAETNLIDDIYLPSLVKEEFEGSKAFEITQKNKGDINSLITNEKSKELAPPTEFNFSTYDEVENFKAQHMTKENLKMFSNGVADFAYDLGTDGLRSLVVAGINGIDFGVQFIPVIEKLMEYQTGGFVSKDGKFVDLIDDKQVMDFAMNLSNNLGEFREFVKNFDPLEEDKKKKGHNFVTEMIGIMGQDLAYSIPIYKTFKKLGFSETYAIIFGYGLGGAIGIEDEIFGNTSTFTQHYLESDVKKLKDFVGVLPNTTYDQIADEVVQTFEYGFFSYAIPQLIKSFQFMKKYIPAMASGTAIATIPGDEASANPIKGIFTAGQNIFKSAVKASVEKLPNKGTGIQMFNTIKNMEGVKSSEMKWIGLDNFLTNNKTVTKTEIENFVKSNSIDVSEVKFGGKLSEKQFKLDDELENMINTFESKWLKANMSASLSGNRATQEADVLLANNLNYDVYATSFSKAESQAVGRAETGTMDFNTLSSILGENPSLDKMVKLKNGNLTIKEKTHYRELIEADAKRMDTFQIAPLEFEKYQVENAKRIHNEMLSEATGVTKFHAETTSGGEDYTELVFKIKDKNIPIETTSKRYSQKKIKNLKFFSKRHMNVENEIAHVRFKTRDLNGKKILAVEEMQSDLAIQSQKKKDAGSMAGYMKSDEFISDFPFKNTWYELTIKRLIRYAADNGFDAIAIPKSSIIKDRWQMTGGMADNIQVMELSDHYRIKFMNEDGITLLNKLYKKNAEGTKLLEKKIGESQMSKITEHYKDSKKLDVLTTDFKGKLDKKVYAGKGEGTTHLYDKVMPSFMRKYSKKWNAKVYDDTIKAITKAEYGVDFPPGFKKDINIPVTILEITPEMKKSVLEQGQPLFEFLGLATAGAATSKAVSDNIENNSISQSTK